MDMAFRYMLVGGVVGVFALNVLLGGYLFVRFLLALGKKRPLQPWAGLWVAAGVLFVTGCLGIFQGGILLLGGNLLLLGYTIFRQRRTPALRESGGRNAVTNEDVWPPPPTGPAGAA